MNFQPSTGIPDTADGARQTRTGLIELRDHAAQAAQARDIFHFEQVLAAAETGSPPVNAGLLGDKALFFSPSGRTAIAYGQRRHHQIALSEPVGLASEVDAIVESFLLQASRRRARPCFYAVSPAFAPLAARHGLKMVKIGERALLDLTTFSLAGKTRQVIRTHRNRHIKNGYRVEVLAPRTGLSHEARLREISAEWLARNGGKEKAFALGAHDPVYVHSLPLAVVFAPDGTIPAYATLWPGAAKQRIGIDLMRAADDAPNGVMDYLFAEMFLWAQAEGYKTFDLNTAPLSGLSLDPSMPLTTSLALMTFEYGEKLYNFKGVRRFKQKFHPVWEDVFLALRPNASPLTAMAHAALLINKPSRG